MRRIRLLWALPVVAAVWTLAGLAERVHSTAYTRSLVTWGSMERCAAWSPDGRQIAFSSNREGTYGVYVVPSFGGTPRRVTDCDLPESRPTWSPDGTQIAFAYGHLGQVDIVSVNVNTGELVNMTEAPGIETDPAWSPSGDDLAYVAFRNGNWDIYILHVPSGEERRLTYHEAHDEHPAWSPDGERLAFTSDRDPQGVYLVGADGERLKRVVGDVGDDEWGSWVARPKPSETYAS